MREKGFCCLVCSIGTGFVQFVMEDEISDTMNLDLNLGPGPEAISEPLSSEDANLENWMDNRHDRVRAVLWRRRWRNQLQRLQTATATRNNPEELDQTPDAAQDMSVDLDGSFENLGNASTMQAGEGSVAAGDRINEDPKMCGNNNGFLLDDISENKDNVGKGSDNEGSFFDCNICLDLSKDPVVTCCGHLFCWSCIYQWLHLHSFAKECPVCKGEVTIKSVTPIYGRTNVIHEVEDESGVKIPPRPQAKRVESLRQTIKRSALNIPVEEMIRRLSSRLDLTQDLNPSRNASAAPAVSGRDAAYVNRLLTLRRMRGSLAIRGEDFLDEDDLTENNTNQEIGNRHLTSRRIRGEQNSAIPVEDVEEVNLTQNNTAEPEVSHPSQLSRRRLHMRRAARMSSLSSALGGSAEHLVEAYIRNHSVGMNQEEDAPPVGDSDSFSSIAAVINSGSQIDNAIEIDSVVSLSTSTSRRRGDASRVSDVDSGDSRPPRRRRLH